MNTFFVNDEHKLNTEWLISEHATAKTDNRWAMAFYLLGHPDIYPHFDSKLVGKTSEDVPSLLPFTWYFENDIEIGSGLHGLLELARHLFSTGRTSFDLDRYLYKWDRDNFEVAMSIVRTARNGLSYPRPLNVLIAEGRVN